MDLVEVHLEAPLFFDDESGYWTGEPDTGILDKALFETRLPADVQVVRDSGGITVRGRRSAVAKAVSLFQARGLEKPEP